MGQKILGIVAVCFLFTGCFIFETTQQKEQKYGKEEPVIQEFFASPMVRSGDDWRIYLRVYDPDGDMKSIAAYCSGLADVGHIYFIPLPKENRKELSGYVSWHIHPEVTHSTEALMTIQIEDMAGHLSKAVSFPFKVVSSGKQQTPPEGVFEERYLGPILINARTHRGV